MIALLLMVALFIMLDSVSAIAFSVLLVVSMIAAYHVAFRHQRPTTRWEWFCGIYVLVMLVGGASAGQP